MVKKIWFIIKSMDPWIHGSVARAAAGAAAGAACAAAAVCIFSCTYRGDAKRMYLIKYIQQQ